LEFFFSLGTMTLFSPTEQELKRFWQRLSGGTLKEGDDRCIFFSSATKRHIFRNRQYNPKYLLLRWYVPGKEWDVNDVALFCCPRNPKTCVHPFHILRKDEDMCSDPEEEMDAKEREEKDKNVALVLEYIKEKFCADLPPFDVKKKEEENMSLKKKRKFSDFQKNKNDF
jgi:hypothetical protein